MMTIHIDSAPSGSLLGTPWCRFNVLGMLTMKSHSTVRSIWPLQPSIWPHSLCFPPLPHSSAEQRPLPGCPLPTSPGFSSLPFPSTMLLHPSRKEYTRAQTTYQSKDTVTGRQEATNRTHLRSNWGPDPEEVEFRVTGTRGKWEGR